MNPVHKKTIYQFTLLFHRLKTRKRRNLIIRMCQYLSATSARQPQERT